MTCWGWARNKPRNVLIIIIIIMRGASVRHGGMPRHGGQTTMAGIQRCPSLLRLQNGLVLVSLSVVKLRASNHIRGMEVKLHTILDLASSITCPLVHAKRVSSTHYVRNWNVSDLLRTLVHSHLQLSQERVISSGTYITQCSSVGPCHFHIQGWRITQASCLLHAGFSLGLLFNSGNGDMLLRNVGCLSTYYTASEDRTLNSHSCENFKSFSKENR
jgi:hypothetical protein